MKKLMFLAAAFVLMASAASAQFSYGIKGGLNLANISSFDGNMKPSVYVGGFCNFYFNDFVGLTPELIYSRQGSSDSENGTKMKMRLNYLNIPVMANLFLMDNLSLDLGPQFGLLAGAQLWAKENGTSAKTDVVDWFKTIDVSFGIGLTYDLGKVFVQGRYNLGLTNNNDTVLDSKWKNNVIQLGAGYRF